MLRPIGRRGAPSKSICSPLAALPAAQRAVVLLVDRDGCSFDEAAEILGVATGTVASRLSRARAALRSALGSEEER